MGKRRIPEDVDYIATIKRFFDAEETEFDPAMREKLERLIVQVVAQQDRLDYNDRRDVKTLSKLKELAERYVPGPSKGYNLERFWEDFPYWVETRDEREARERKEAPEREAQKEKRYIPPPPAVNDGRCAWDESKYWPPDPPPAKSMDWTPPPDGPVRPCCWTHDRLAFRRGANYQYSGVPEHG